MGIDSLVAAGRSSMFKPLQYPPPRYCSGRVMVAPAAFTPGRARTRSSNCWKNDAIWGFLYFADGNGILHVNTLSGLKPGLTARKRRNQTEREAREKRQPQREAHHTRTQANILGAGDLCRGERPQELNSPARQ